MDTPVTSPATLVVVRNSPRDIQHREVQVFVDGDRIGVLRYGRKIERQVLAGRRSIRVYNTLVSKSVEVDVEPGGVYEFSTGNEARGCLMGWLMLVGAGPMSVFIEPVASDGGEFRDVASIPAEPQSPSVAKR